MILSEKSFREDERAIYKLRELYRSYGYSHYRVSKFEEYDLYARNKSFLVSENLLTFTDTNGKLMALKPDVTLSIIKNVVANDKASYKLYYDERVYRTTTAADGFREIKQIGLESVGNIDLFAQCEVIMLALKSLESISDRCILDMSQMSLLEGLLESAGVSFDSMGEYLALMGSKNIPAIRLLCAKQGIDTENTERICTFASVYAPLCEALEVIRPLIRGDKMSAAYDSLCKIYYALDNYGMTEKIFLDFSIVNDMNYYDGIIFKGFIDGIPDSVLSGGRYDRLMEKFGKRTEAIGFAVYLDKLERFGKDESQYDVDVLLVYGDGTPAEEIISKVSELRKNGKTVRTANALDESIRYNELVRLEGGTCCGK